MRRKDVYICYNRADVEWVRRLAAQVESETIDGRKSSRRLKVFFDKWDIRAGQSLLDQMNKGMKAVRYIVAVLSPEFIKADFPRFEWKQIIAQDPNNARGRLIPVLLRDTSLDGTEEIELCAPFQDLRYIDFRKPAEFREGFVELIRRVRNLPEQRGRILPPLAASTLRLPAPVQPNEAQLPDEVTRNAYAEMVEILHLDIKESSAFFKGKGDSDKYLCMKLLHQYFTETCKKHLGIERQWTDEGGYAYFKSQSADQMGSAVRAAQAFLNGLSSKIPQIAMMLGWEEFFLRYRIKAHRGEVFVGPNSQLSSATPRNFESFLKCGKNFAPRNDEFFITKDLFDVLKHAAAQTFVSSRAASSGSLRTTLYRWRRFSAANRKISYQLGCRVKTLQQREWDHFCYQFEAQVLAHAACNQITKGLISLLNGNSSQHRDKVITSNAILKLALDAVYAFLQLIFNERRVRVSYWQHDKQKQALQMVDYRYPEGESSNTKRRVFPIEEQQWKVCECFKTMKFIVTSDVAEARSNHLWNDFDRSQKSDHRRLDSAMQIPVYCEGIDDRRQIRGVLSFDVDKPDMFLSSDVSLWRERLVGFLAALALSEKLREHMH